MRKITRIELRIAALLLALCLLMLGGSALAEAAEISIPEGYSLPETPLPDPAQIQSAEDLPWYLTLVNSTHAVPENWVIPQFTTLKHNQCVDSRIYPQLQAMFDQARREGVLPVVMTSYRTYEDQKAMLVSKYKKYRNQGKSESEAQEAALRVAAYPGYSEHQLGLAVDIDSANTEKCSNSKVWEWMQHHCQEYGFIWRYPGEKSEITGIDNEGWHFRYVGVEAATYIMEHQLCLEEYLEQTYGIK